LSFRSPLGLRKRNHVLEAFELRGKPREVQGFRRPPCRTRGGRDLGLSMDGFARRFRRAAGRGGSGARSPRHPASGGQDRPATAGLPCKRSLTRTMSAAACGRELSRTSSWPFSSIARREREPASANAPARLTARSRSASLAAGSALSFPGGLDQRYGMHGIGEIGDDLAGSAPSLGEPGEARGAHAGIAGQNSLEQVEDA
jgi:hypothetical protein